MTDNHPAGPGADATLEFWFDFASPYSYLSVMRIEAAAAASGVALRWKPFLLGPVFKALGWPAAPFVVQKEKGEYVWKDLARRAAKYGLPLHRPAEFPRLFLLPPRVALAGEGQPWVPEFCRRLMQLNFSRGDEVDINSPLVVAAELARLGQPAEALIAEANGAPIKARLKAQTETARARGMFGAPTFFVGEEMFWGDDRLEDALAYATGAAP